MVFFFKKKKSAKLTNSMSWARTESQWNTLISKKIKCQINYYWAVLTAETLITFRLLFLLPQSL